MMRQKAFFKSFYPCLMPFPASRVAAKPKPVSVLLKQRCYQTIKCATKTDGPTKSRAQSWFGHETSPFFNPQLYTQRRRRRNSWPDSSFWWHFRWISLHQMENADVCFKYKLTKATKYLKNNTTKNVPFLFISDKQFCVFISSRSAWEQTAHMVIWPWHHSFSGRDVASSKNRQ